MQDFRPLWARGGRNTVRSVANASPESLSEAKRRILWTLKRRPGATAPVLAQEFGLTDTAIRQHLDALESIGLVERRTDRPNGRGRPPVLWTVTPQADAHFPDRHGELAEAMLLAVRDTLGQDAVATVLAEVARRQREAYEAALPPVDHQTTEDRLADLARLRSADGFLTDVVVASRSSSGGSYLLVEHHCPILDAARCCTDICAQDLEFVKGVLGDRAEVVAQGSLASGDACCTYRVTPRD